MRLEIEAITPERAKAILANNIINRNINKFRVNQYALDMTKGKWQMNGESIKFNSKGELIDGQHRLSAIIKAGITVTMAVLYEVDNSITIYDRGRNRNVTDSLIMAGMDTSIANTVCVAIAKLYVSLLKGTEKNFNVSDEQVREFLLEHQEGLYIVNSLVTNTGSNKSGRISIRCAPIGLALLTAIEQHFPEEKLERWAEVVKTGFVNNINEQAAVVFRNDILSGAVPIGKGNGQRQKSTFQAEKSIQDFVDGKPRRMSYANWSDPVYSNY